MLVDTSVGHELMQLLAEPLALTVLVITMAFAVVPIMVDRSRHRPGNFAPIQLISALGAWALLLLNEALLINSFRESSPILACASVATLLTTLWLFLRGEGGRVVNDQAPETIEAMIREIERILGGAKRVGIQSVSAVIVKDHGPVIGVSVSRRGRVVVRVRQEIMAWLARHRRPGGAGSAAVESLLRFTVLHELGHVLNGDHFTYRFVRSVLLAHLCWVPVVIVAAALLPWGVPAAQAAVATALCLLLPFLGQCLLARRFLAEREEVADLRAMQTLDPSDASLLRTRSGRRTDRLNPTLLEKLMTDLRVQGSVRHRANWLSKAVQWVWPEAGHLHERCELLALGHSGRTPRPNQWAAFMGMQCGLLCISLLACASAAFSSLSSWQPGSALRVAVILMALMCSTAASYCGMRADPAFMRLHDLPEVPSRRMAGMIFYLTFSVSALLLYLLPAFSGISAVLSFPLLSLSVGLSAAQALYGSIMAVGSGEIPEDTSVSLRHPMLNTGPLILIYVGIIICCSATATWAFGLGRVWSRAWLGVAIVAGAGFLASYFFSRSTNAAVRAIPPITWLDSSGNVFAIRIFWCDLYVDCHTVSQSFIVIFLLSTWFGSALLFACGAAFAARLLSRIATDEVVFYMLLLMSAVLIGLMERVPQRADGTAYLTDLKHLRMFDSLLTAVRTARLPVTEQLSNALAGWVNRDSDLPSAVLPEPRAIWKLESLLLLVRIVRGIGEEKMLAGWRPAIADALRRVVTDGAVFVNRSRPSLAYTVLAAQVIEEADLAAEIPLEPILDSIAVRLELCMNGEESASGEALTSACRVLDVNGRAHPGVEWMRMQSLTVAEYHLTRPIIRLRLRELVAWIALLENTALQDRLLSIVRARVWETLQLNPWNDVPLLLDCYLAAVSLGERDSPRLSLAGSTIGEVATRMADDLTKTYGEPDESGSEC
jgi:hypothetical protein